MEESKAGETADDMPGAGEGAGEGTGEGTEDGLRAKLATTKFTDEPGGFVEDTAEDVEGS